jgi:MFS transporter, DHA1 family, multidrug resistance protein
MTKVQEIQMMRDATAVGASAATKRGLLCPNAPPERTDPVARPDNARPPDNLPAMPAPACTSPGAPRVSRGLAAMALALLLGLQPVTTDIYLPALPALTRELGASMASAQLTLSALILAFGVAQLFWGPLADRIGRRPVLLAGLALYTAASLGSTLAGSIEQLVAWRVLQGTAMAAAVVCARAMVRDLYEPLEGAQVMSLGLSGLGAIAIIGPLVGGLATWAWGWHAALAVVTAIGALTLLFVVLRLPETLTVLNPQATRLRPLLRAWHRIARHRTFVAWTALVSCTYGGLFTLLAGSSFVYIELLGLSPGAYGLCMAVGSSSYMAGTFVCRSWLARLGMAGAVRRGAVLTLAGGLLMLVPAVLELHHAGAVLLPQCLFAFGHGIHQPCGQAGAVSPFPQAAGAASALAGFALAGTAFLVGLWLGQVLDGSLMPYALTLAFWSALTALVAWTLVQRIAVAPRPA